MTFLRILSETVRVFKWRCAAYCLMTNHYHAVVVTPEPNVGIGMKRLNGLYAQGFNRRHGLRGHLFEDRYRSIDVIADDQFVTLLQYVVFYLVQSGMCAGPDQWPWSATARPLEPHRRHGFSTSRPSCDGSTPTTCGLKRCIAARSTPGSSCAAPRRRLRTLPRRRNDPASPT